ncbi:MAG: hypothetical protein IT287_05020 [Bdellovibrionaceae bacterium]|nr:hypothetical protein [Pseudobdellovibrionaceae bacterium]
MVALDSEYQLWIVDSDSKNSWFHYLNYLSRFQITKYYSDIKNTAAMVLHMSPKDFPAAHVLFVDSGKDVSAALIKTKWESLGKPRTLVFPSTSRVFSDLLVIDKEKFRLFQ